jgi:hypothetical protein
VRQIDPSIPGSQILFVQRLYFQNRRFQIDGQGIRQHRYPVLIAFAFADDNLPPIEMDIFEVETQGL